jgi:hypothetical protein
MMKNDLKYNAQPVPDKELQKTGRLTLTGM